MSGIALTLALAAGLLAGCTGAGTGVGTGGAPSPVAGQPGGPSPPVEAAGDIRFVLRDTYGFRDRVEVKIANAGERAYLYNSTGYEACNLTYRDEGGREFIIPPGTHCDLIAIEEIEPGQTVTLFEWQLDECTKDSWGCVESEPLEPGVYTIEGSFRAAGGGPRAHARATFEIVE